MDALSLLLALQTVDDSMLEHQTSEACCSFGLFSGQHFIAELAAVSLLRALQAGGSMLRIIPLYNRLCHRSRSAFCRCQPLR